MQQSGGENVKSSFPSVPNPTTPRSSPAHPTNGTVIIEYIWIQRTSSAFNPSQMMRSKSRCIPFEPLEVDDVPSWSADGLSTCQGEMWDFVSPVSKGRYTFLTHIILRPIFLCNDPLRGNPHKIVLCECVLDDGEAPPSNYRARARAVFEELDAAYHETVKELHILQAQESSSSSTTTTTTPSSSSSPPPPPPPPTPTPPPPPSLSSLEPPSHWWVSFEQESLLLQADGKTPVGWPLNMAAIPKEQISYLHYCSVSEAANSRPVLEHHMKACLDAGLHVSGANLEVLVGAVEFQIGPVYALRAADELWIARYLLARIAELHGYHVTFDPKPVADADGIGLHVNFSTLAMREEETGWDCISNDILSKLKETHKQHLSAYGPGNERRLTGKEEYSSMEKFTAGIGDRNASVRISFMASPSRLGGGYIEDRRPGANADPYLILEQYGLSLGRKSGETETQEDKEEKKKIGDSKARNVGSGGGNEGEGEVSEVPPFLSLHHQGAGEGSEQVQSKLTTTTTTTTMRRAAPLLPFTPPLTPHAAAMLGRATMAAATATTSSQHHQPLVSMLRAPAPGLVSHLQSVFLTPSTTINAGTLTSEGCKEERRDQ